MAVANQGLEKTTDDLERWVFETLINESKRLIRRRSAAETEIESLKQEVLTDQVITLKRTPDPKYGDAYNRLVSTLLDELIQNGTAIPQTNQLAFAASLFQTALKDKMTLEDVQTFLEAREIRKTKQRLKKKLEKAASKLVSPKAAINYCALSYEIDCLKTDDVWNLGKYDQLLLQAVAGQPLNLITMLCTINKFDYQGAYTLVPDIYAYKTDPRLEAVPLILTELFAVQQLMQFYGVQTTLTIFVADTDYTEVGQYGPVSESNLRNLNNYLSNLAEFVSTYGNGQASLKAISEVTTANPEYDRVKNTALQNVSGFKNDDFSRQWYSRFEQAVEKVSESQTKKRLFPETEIRRRSLEITRKIWAVNAAQGAVFSNLGPNTLFLSTERRERDTNYIIDAAATKNFPPVLYILKTASSWNRKLVTDPA